MLALQSKPNTVTSGRIWQSSWLRTYTARWRLLLRNPQGKIRNRMCEAPKRVAVNSEILGIECICWASSGGELVCPKMRRNETPLGGHERWKATTAGLRDQSQNGSGVHDYAPHHFVAWSTR